jgi:hypothetical protein
LRQDLRRTLPERFVPRAFVELDLLPRSASGVLLCEELDRPRLESPDDEHYASPRSASEMLLAEIWREALAVDRVGLHDNFFALGGYSLICFQVLDRVERQTGHRLSPRPLLLDSLQQIAAQLDTLNGGPPQRDQIAKQTKNSASNAGNGLLRRLGKLVPGRL